MTHAGGSGRYVEGERVFAPPSGVFDADWVAGIVLDRGHGGDRVDLARAAQAAWAARGEGGDEDAQRAAVEDAGFGPATAAAAVRAVDDYVSAYGA